MFRSLHMKLVLVLVLLVISVMAVVGTFLINSVTDENISDFKDQMALVFTPEFILRLQDATLEGQKSSDTMKQMLAAYASQLGIDENRVFYILSKSGEYLSGSDDAYGETAQITPNILKAMTGEVGQEVQKLGSYFDVAVPIHIADGTVSYIVGVLDNRTELQDLTWNLVTILVRGMLFGLVVAILLSFLLSKTITNPVERLTEQAAHIASGDFGSKAEIYSTDEIGILTQTFNEMAEIMESTLKDVQGERNKLDTLFKHMADGVVAFDSQGTLLHKNPAAERMLGRRFKLGDPYQKVLPNIHINEYKFESEDNVIEVDYSANKRILKILLAPIQVPYEGIMAVLHDVTEQKKLDESRREFVANVSHELRTPLTNIKSYTETIMDTGDDLPPDIQKNFLQVVYDEADRMTHIVKDLLTLSRLDHNRMEMQMGEVELVSLAEAAAKTMEIECDNLKLEIIHALPPSLPVIWADKQRIEQVLINIISNAIKYNKPEGSITLSGYSDDKTVTIQISDTGIGVPKEDVAKVFERFYRVDKARSREQGGTGLGLAIAKEIVENNGGTISFDSQLGVGSAVTLTLPRYERTGEKDA